MKKNFLTHELKWLNKPEVYSIDSEKITIKTSMNTDFEVSPKKRNQSVGHC